jgi:hypothetical protein
VSTVLIWGSKVDRAEAAQIAAALGALGLKVWSEKEVREPEAVLQDLDALLALWSPASVQDYELRNTARSAINASRLINVGWGAAAPFPFDRMPTPRLDGWTGLEPHSGWVQLVSLLDAHLSHHGGAPGALIARLGPWEAAIAAKLGAAQSAYADLAQARADTVETFERLKRQTDRGEPQAVRRATQDEGAIDIEAVSRAEARLSAATTDLAALLGVDRQVVSAELSRAAPAAAEATIEPPAKPAAEARLARIAVSYRRADSRDITWRIVDRLTDRYGEGAVFIDIDGIPPGEKFRDYIAATLAKSDIFLAMIGRRWTGPQRGAPARIMEADDLVRIEVETALGHGLPIIPVLLDDARMPAASALPDSLHELRSYNAAPVETGRDFNAQIARLIKAIDDLLARRAGPAG